MALYSLIRTLKGHVDVEKVLMCSIIVCIECVRNGIVLL